VVVRFYPVTAGIPFATGKTDATGAYRLSSEGGKDGAAVGKHRVVINWPPRERTDDRERRPLEPGPLIPLPYTVANDTPLLVEVKSGGEQTIDLPLEQK
jgi:hypothetical protein